MWLDMLIFIVTHEYIWSRARPGKNDLITTSTYSSIFRFIDVCYGQSHVYNMAVYKLMHLKSYYRHKYSIYGNVICYKIYLILSYQQIEQPKGSTNTLYIICCKLKRIDSNNVVTYIFHLDGKIKKRNYWFSFEH